MQRRAMRPAQTLSALSDEARRDLEQNHFLLTNGRPLPQNPLHSGGSPTSWAPAFWTYRGSFRWMASSDWCLFEPGPP